jgi:hypothetical protein
MQQSIVVMRRASSATLMVQKRELRPLNLYRVHNKPQQLFFRIPVQTTQQPNAPANRKVAIGLWAIFITQFVSFLFINARNIAQPGIIHELHGMTLFSWLIALPAVTGAASTLLFGKLSDIYGRRAILLLSIGMFLLGLGISTRATSMAFLVASATFMSIGHFPIIPLCFSAIFSHRQNAQNGPDCSACRAAWQP